MGGEQELIDRIANLEKLVETLTIKLKDAESQLQKIDDELHNPVKIDGGFSGELYRPIKLYGTVGEGVNGVAVAKGVKNITLTCDFATSTRSGLYGTPVTITRPTTQGEWIKMDLLKDAKRNLINSIENNKGVNNYYVDEVNKIANDTSHFFIEPTQIKQ